MDFLQMLVNITKTDDDNLTNHSVTLILIFILHFTCLSPWKPGLKPSVIKK